MRYTPRGAVSSLRLTLHASPDSAGGGRGRTRVVPRRDMLFSLVDTSLYVHERNLGSSML